MMSRVIGLFLLWLEVVARATGGPLRTSRPFLEGWFVSAHRGDRTRSPRRGAGTSPLRDSAGIAPDFTLVNDPRLAVDRREAALGHERLLTGTAGYARSAAGVRANRVGAVPVLGRRPNELVEAHQAWLPLVDLDHVPELADRVDECELGAGPRLGPGGQLVARRGQAPVCRGQIVDDQEG